jgi:putative ABC transport system substrate-binding protein
MAQGAVRRPLVAVLVVESPISVARFVSGLRQGLQALGYVEGRNIDLVDRYADGDMARLPALAEEMAWLSPDVLVTTTTAATLAVKQATTTILSTCHWLIRRVPVL